VLGARSTWGRMSAYPPWVPSGGKTAAMSAGSSWNRGPLTGKRRRGGGNVSAGILSPAAGEAGPSRGEEPLGKLGRSSWKKPIEEPAMHRGYHGTGVGGVQTIRREERARDRADDRVPAWSQPLPRWPISTTSAPPSGARKTLRGDARSGG